MADVRRLAELSMPTELAKEVAAQMEAEAGFTPAAAVADSAASTVAGIVADHNALLASLRAAGIIAT